MQIQSIVYTRLVEDKERLLLNFVFSLWFEKELEEINNGTNEKKKKRYAKLDPFKMVVEPPVAFEKDYFYVCAADRPGGTLLVDKKVPYLTMETFLEKSKLSDKIKTDGNYNQAIAEGVKNGTVTYLLLEKQIRDINNLSADPIYYVTKIRNKVSPSETGKWCVIFDSRGEQAYVKDLHTYVFRDYTFESIAITEYKKGDPEYPSRVPNIDYPDSYYTGEVIVTDSTFKGGKQKYIFIDLGLLAQLRDIYLRGSKIVSVDPGPVTTLSPTDSSPVIGEGTVVKLLGKSSTTKLMVTLRDELSYQTSADIIVTDDSAEDSLTVSLQPKELPFMYSFVYDTGERRRYSARFRTSSRDDITSVTIPVTYDLKPGSITPVITSVYFKDAVSNKATVQMTFLDEDNNPINKVSTQFLGKGYKMFENDVMTFLGDSTRLGVRNNATAYDTLSFDADVTKTGEVEIKFTDPALKDITYTIKPNENRIHPVLQKVEYDEYWEKLVITYGFEQYGMPYRFSYYPYFVDEKRPELTDPYYPTDPYTSPYTKCNQSGFVLKYDIPMWGEKRQAKITGKVYYKPQDLTMEINDVVDIGGNEYIPELTAVISSIDLNGGIITPGENKTTVDVGKGSVIHISEPKKINERLLRLTRFTDALGVDITDKVTVTYRNTGDNNDASQFEVKMTLTDYQWPMSFDNQGSNGEFECEFKLIGSTASPVSAKTSYKLTYGNESITPRAISAQLSNNSLNRGSIYISFYDKDGNPFETGLEQNIPINPPLFGNSDLTYIGDKITYGADDDHHYGAHIPVNFKQFGDLSLSFADTTFKTVTTSVADPNGKYTLAAFDEKFADSGDYMVRFRLNKDGKPYSLNDGKIIDDSIKATIDSQSAKIGGIGWTPDTDAGAVLTVYITLPEGTDKSTFTAEVSGQFYVGINNVPLDVAYETDHAPV